ncbi:hypothetical protein FA13DRAFT_1732444 [Coprinellus micaceus]|uniref:Uncharacterized protein n=1 Tax=Coprinellus micaceus TaxID=71717 RepID=A0A4Y7TCC3_COPMI|nr:hypothetical protein FA13DRAFT_1732444 [Coprinellus micaceus]
MSWDPFIDGRREFLLAGVLFEDMEDLDHDPFQTGPLNRKPKERTFSSPAAEINERTKELISQVEDLRRVQRHQRRQLIKFKRLVDESIADAAESSSDSELREVRERVRGLSKEMKAMQTAHTLRLDELYEHMEEHYPVDLDHPNFWEKLGMEGEEDDDGDEEEDEEEDEKEDDGEEKEDEGEDDEMDDEDDEDEDEVWQKGNLK